MTSRKKKAKTYRVAVDRWVLQRAILFVSATNPDNAMVSAVRLARGDSDDVAWETLKIHRDPGPSAYEFLREVKP